MTGRPEPMSGPAMPTARWARQLLVAIHVPALGSPLFFTLLWVPSLRPLPVVLAPVAASVAIAAIQVRHSVAAARGRHPRFAAWTLLVLAVLVYGPIAWFGFIWGIAQVCMIASAGMLLPSRLRVVGSTAAVLASAAISTYDFWGRSPDGFRFALDAGGAVTYNVVIGGAMYAAARLVRVLNDLELSRTQLAEAAVRREHLRVSRDLHDLLGQTLTAVSLKGDLAIRLLPRDPEAARSHLENLTGIAREALRGVPAVAQDELTPSLATEADGAVALLRAAGVQATVEIDLDEAPSDVREAMAWALREGVTNVLRHSTATACTITGGQHEETASLTIINDNAGSSSEPGSGLAGLARRVEAVGGSVSAQRSADGTFRLSVDIPLVHAGRVSA
jgi:two-component system sensor histidine kinase DesK